MPVRTMIAIAVAFTIAVILTPLLRNAARRRGYLDVPNEASSHTVPTPRNGGFAIFAGIMAAFLLVLDVPRTWHVMLVAALAALLPAIDEFRPLPRGFRLIVQIGLAIGAVLFLKLGPTSVALPKIGVVQLGVAGSVFAIVWLVAVVNAYNFMDGLNGLSSSAAIICGTVTALMFVQYHDAAGAVIAAGLAAAAAGFLPWNLPSGSVFMGDVGSATLGFLLAILSLRLIHDGASPVAACLPVLSFCSDAFLTIIRRALRGERFFATRHRSHFYQWLNQQGWSHARVTAVWVGLIAATGAVSLGYKSMTSVAWMTALGFVAVLHAAVFGWVASRQRSA